MDIRYIGVVGAGVMGGGIAQVAAASGYQVLLYDSEPDAAELALQSIAVRLARDVRKGRVTQAESDVILTRVRATHVLGDFSLVQFVVESVPERMDVKKEVFRRLDEVCKPSVIYATNTSGLSITELSAATKRPDMCIGMHFFNPVSAMKLVELVRGAETSDDVLDVTQEVCRKLGKETIVVQESPLFVVNRILVPMLNEAIFVLQEGLASVEDIDKAMVLGVNHPTGPLALADLVGLDTLLYTLDTLFSETGDSKYRPAPLLRRMVRAGKLGRKSGRGFYTYNE